MRRHILAALLTAAVLVPAQAESQPPKRWAAWQFQWENDAFALFSGSDEHYTNGIRFSWIRNGAPSPTTSSSTATLSATATASTRRAGSTTSRRVSWRTTRSAV